MKASLLPVLPLLSAGFSTHAALDSKITTRDNDKDGKPDSGTIIVERSGKKVLQRTEKLDASGAAIASNEVLYHEGKKVFAVMRYKAETTRTFFPKAGVGIGEQDKNSDGKPENLVSIGPKGEPVDAFTFDEGDCLKPAPDADLEKLREWMPEFEREMEEVVSPATETKPARPRERR